MQASAGPSVNYVPFQALPARPALWRPFSGSLCAHVAIVWLAGSYFQFLASRREYKPEVHTARILNLTINPVDPPPVLRSARIEPNPRDGSAGARRVATSRQATTDAESAPQAAALAAATFKMPSPEERRALQTLVQLDLPPTVDLHPDLNVPMIAILTDANLPRRPKPFVAPPERKRVTELPSDVVVAIRPPILEIRPGHAKMPELLAQVNPVLPPPIGSTAPVAAEGPPSDTKQAATTAGDVPAEPVTIISIPDRPVPAVSSMVLPPLNQVAAKNGGSLQGGGGDSNSSTGKGKDAASELKVQGIEKSDRRSGSGSDTSSATVGNGNHPEVSGADLASNDTTTLVTARGGGTGSGESLDPGRSGSSAGMPSARDTDPVRVVRPREGHYDVAVVQSSSGVPGTAALLKGRPVYSVYISVGSQREWILQYCLPVAQARPEPSRVIQLGNVTPVSAPYVFLILRPSIHFRAGARYGFIHGFVNENGRLEQLAEAGQPAIENVAALVQSLEQWEFRPASKDGVPTKVEVLLCIPVAGA